MRVLDMAGVDLSIYVFDYDLTFAVLLMNGDGTIYHRYGTRDHTSAASRLSMASLVNLLRESMEDHRVYLKSPRPPPARPRRPIEEIPAMARKLRKEKVECFHCHMVNDAERDQERDERRWSREETLGMWPLPEKAGLVLDRDDATLLREAAAGSAAARAGLRAGDRLVRVGAERVRSQMDVGWALHRAPSSDARVPVEYLRGGEARTAELALARGWKLPDDLEFSWRASMWSLRPQPGFGGRPAKEEDLRKAGLSPGTFAIRVEYIVDWGERAHVGRSARAAGIRKGDLILSAAGRRDFLSELHFQSWFRFTRKPGEKVPLEVQREGKTLKIELPVLP